MNGVFCERLKELRQEKGIGQVQLARELDVGKSIISLWELGKCEPTLSKLVAMSRYFGVSIDYLAGLED
ncbi:MAG TPA: helix-turn-helix domain-containing protein [Firmicutes bacterium]|nr:helix-turn-helix domain-containing protein [Bacillota bacterium]